MASSRGKRGLPAQGQSQQGIPDVAPISPAETVDTQTADKRVTRSSSMSSQRSRAPRGGARAGAHETGEEAQLWNDMQEKLIKLGKNEIRAKELGKEIQEMEASIKAKEIAGTSEQTYPSPYKLR